MMTKEEFAAKNQIIDILRKGGYKTYAKLVDLFDINLTSDPHIAAAVEINKARILINRGVPEEAISTLIRHEILHRWLEHALRLENHIGKDNWNKRTRRESELGNIAGDYEISNRGYTDLDKEVVRNLKLEFPDGTKIPFPGLVTELDHPDWTNLSIEEMYDKLKEESDKQEQEAIDFINDLINQMENNQEQSNSDNSQDSQEGDSQSSNSSKGQNKQKENTPKSKGYIDGWKKALEDYRSGKLRI